MQRIVAGLAAAAATVLQMWGQSQPAPAFEVATIKEGVSAEIKIETSQLNRTPLVTARRQATTPSGRGSATVTEP